MNFLVFIAVILGAALGATVLVLVLMQWSSVSLGVYIPVGVAIWIVFVALARHLGFLPPIRRH